MVLDGGTYDSVVYTATGPDSGTIDRDGDAITYVGLEPIFDNSSAVDRIIRTSDFDDIATLTDNGTTLTLGSVSLIPTFESITFNKPSNSLTINLGDDPDISLKDILFIKSFDVTGVDLIVNGEDGDDMVFFDGFVNAGNVSVNAENIHVMEDAKINATGRVSLNAYAEQSLTITNPNLLTSLESLLGMLPELHNSASVLVEGDITANDGDVVISALLNTDLSVTVIDALLDTDLSVTAVLPLLAINTSATASARVESGAQINAGTFSLSAKTQGLVYAESPIVAITTFSDSAIATIDDAQVTAGKVVVSAETATNYEVVALVATNYVIGHTTASIINATITAGADGVEVKAVDSSNFTASSPEEIIDLSNTGLDGLIVLNDVEGTAESYIKDSDVSSVGDLNIKAYQKATITAIVDSQSEAYDVSGTTFALGGVIASNAVQSHANAYVSGGQVSVSGGELIVDARNDAVINAKVDNYVESNGDSVGVTLAFNTVGWKTNLAFNILDVFTLGALSLGDENQEVKAWIGDNARVDAANGVRITADSDASINAEITSAASAVSATTPQTTNVSVGAVVALNKISVDIEAYVDGAASVEALSGDIVLDATDNATIAAEIKASTSAWGDDVDAETTYSISANVARNEVRSDTQAFIRNSGSSGIPDSKVRAAAGAIKINAKQDASINATARATSVAGVETLNIADEGLESRSVGGAMALNFILGSTNAFLQDSVVEAVGSVGSEGTVTITAKNNVSLHALVESAADAIANGLLSESSAYAIGVSLAFNYVGYKDLVNKDRIQTAAYIQDGNVSADAGVSLSATSNAEIEAKVAASLTAVSANLLAVNTTIFADPFQGLPTPSATAAGGVMTFNWIATDVQAYIDGVDGITTDAGDITVTAHDNASVTATAEAQAIAVELVLGSPVSFYFGGVTGGTAIGMSLAFNEVDSNTEAYLRNVSGIEIGDCRCRG